MALSKFNSVSTFWKKTEIEYHVWWVLLVLVSRVNFFLRRAHNKPFRDVYLHAANKMGIRDPSGCLVIEDSPLGLRGGASAGLSVFGYTERMDKNRLLEPGAHHTY
ncbi:MAG: HAD-IA family hydrolase [Congregibacter sp.]